MKFEEIMPLLRKGRKGYRTGWNGKGLFVAIVPDYKGLSKDSTINNCINIPYSKDIKFNPYFIIFNSNNNEINTWVPSVSDIIVANDWDVVSEDVVE